MRWLGRTGGCGERRNRGVGRVLPGELSFTGAYGVGEADGCTKESVRGQVRGEWGRVGECVGLCGRLHLRKQGK